MNSAKRLAFFLPNTFTALNIGGGFLSLIFASQEKFYLACIVLVLAALFDSVDGRIARMTGTQSAFGEQFDSLSDVISFGIAPAYLSYHYFFSGLGRIGIFTSFLFLLCGALRLARFNANISKVESDFFQGLPIPGAAMAVIGLVLLDIEFAIIRDWGSVTIPYVIFYSLLMVSSVPFPSFKKAPWVRRNKRGVFLGLIIIIGLTLSFEFIMIFLGISVYVLGSIYWFAVKFGNFKDLFQLQNEAEDEDSFDRRTSGD